MSDHGDDAAPLVFDPAARDELAEAVAYYGADSD